MTNKSIETLALRIAIELKNSYETDSTEEFGKLVKKVDDFMNMFFDLYIITDYSKIQKLRQKIFDRAFEIYNEKYKA